MKDIKPTGVTGRDGYIIAQALYQACIYQESLKAAGDRAYEWSNHQDMKAILGERFPGWGELFAMTDREKGVEPPDLMDEKRTEAEQKEAS